MKLLMRLSSLLLLCFASHVALASIDTYEFKNNQDRERYRVLTEEIRCPKCQNQNIADSNAPIAMDLRAEVYRMVEEGKDNDEIVSFLVDRYGDFVRYRPALNTSTLILWYGPAAFLALGLMAVAIVLWRRKRVQKQAAIGQANSLTADEQQRLAALLSKQSQGKTDL